MSVLVTGAGGRIGRALVQSLHAVGVPVRAASARPARVVLPAGVPVDELDLGAPDRLPDGVDTVFLYANADGVDAFVAVAVAAGVSHVVLLSSSSVLTPRDRLATEHLQVEQSLRAAPFTTTILRPGAFASNALSWAWELRSSGSVALPYPASHVASIHELDVAAVAHAVLVDGAGRGGAHTLTGPASQTFAEQLGVIGAVVGRQVEVATIGRGGARARLVRHLDAGYADALLDLWERGVDAPAEVTDAVERLTGRPARTFEQWVRDHAAAWSADPPA